MASLAQIAANRLNAMKSTGPRTDEGKAVSRMNALQHGVDADSTLLPGEDPREFAELAAAYRDRHQPSTPEETFLVDTLIQSDWHRRRYGRIQAELARRFDQSNPDDCPFAELFLADNRYSRAYLRAVRAHQAAQKSWFLALKELQRIQQLHAQAQPDAAALPATENWVRSENPAAMPQPASPSPDPPAADLPVRNRHD
jgi:hypothetical protein